MRAAHIFPEQLDGVIGDLKTDVCVDEVVFTVVCNTIGKQHVEVLLQV
ncbi:hypothetical protein MPY17_32125 [Rhodococcus opacus]|nr:hypothetical protein [Rhodococcus opacus]UOT03536.1 hypothetical protein MPY17_32125 [Rhodococcus opacus]